MSFIMSSVMGMTSKSLKNISQSVPPCICRPSLPVFSLASSTRSDVQIRERLMTVVFGASRYGDAQPNDDRDEWFHGMNNF